MECLPLNRLEKMEPTILFKDVVGWVVMAAGLGVIWGQLTSRQGAQDVRVKKLEKVMTSNDDGGPPFITFATHKDIQAACRLQFNTELGHIKTDMASIKKTIEKGDKDREEARGETQTNFLVVQKLLGDMR